MENRCNSSFSQLLYTNVSKIVGTRPLEKVGWTVSPASCQRLHYTPRWLLA